MSDELLQQALSVFNTAPSQTTEQTTETTADETVQSTTTEVDPKVTQEVVKPVVDEEVKNAGQQDETVEDENSEETVKDENPYKKQFEVLRQKEIEFEKRRVEELKDIKYMKSLRKEIESNPEKALEYMHSCGINVKEVLKAIAEGRTPNAKEILSKVPENKELTAELEQIKKERDALKAQFEEMNKSITEESVQSSLKTLADNMEKVAKEQNLEYFLLEENAKEEAYQIIRNDFLAKQEKYCKDFGIEIGEIRDYLDEQEIEAMVMPYADAVKVVNDKYQKKYEKVAEIKKGQSQKVTEKQGNSKTPRNEVKPLQNADSQVTEDAPKEILSEEDLFEKAVLAMKKKK